MVFDLRGGDLRSIILRLGLEEGTTGVVEERGGVDGVEGIVEEEVWEAEEGWS